VTYPRVVMTSLGLAKFNNLRSKPQVLRITHYRETPIWRRYANELSQGIPQAFSYDGLGSIAFDDKLSSVSIYSLTRVRAQHYSAWQRRHKHTFVQQLNSAEASRSAHSRPWTGA
jgi:hypothetical protein